MGTTLADPAAAGILANPALAAPQRKVGAQGRGLLALQPSLLKAQREVLCPWQHGGAFVPLRLGGALGDKNNGDKTRLGLGCVEEPLQAFLGALKHPGRDGSED